MNTGHEYRAAYPRAGQVAVLCEGDVVGYEISLLRRWLDERLRGELLVDVWPCGTKSAIFGTSDAIGRARPLLIIEDRDFRTLNEAEKDCRRHSRDREQRDVRVLSWLSWQRNEIENYLLEPDVVYPVFSEAFRCSEDDVAVALAEILPVLGTFQAAEYALYRTWRSWEREDPTCLRNRPVQIRHRPNWNDEDCTLRPPDRSAVRDGLAKNLLRWQGSIATAIATERGRTLITEFETKCEEWAGIDPSDDGWLIDWSGKEVLQWLRICLSARYGWYDVDSMMPQVFKWQDLSRAKRDAQDRPLEDALRPRLVRRFLAYLSSQSDRPVLDEWRHIESVVRACRTGKA